MVNGSNQTDARVAVAERCADAPAAYGELERALSEAEAYASKVVKLLDSVHELLESDAYVSSCFVFACGGLGTKYTGLVHYV
jgi:hypothetical protein